MRQVDLNCAGAFCHYWVYVICDELDVSVMPLILVLPNGDAWHINLQFFFCFQGFFKALTGEPSGKKLGYFLRQF